MFKAVEIGVMVVVPTVLVVSMMEGIITMEATTHIIIIKHHAKAEEDRIIVEEMTT